MKVSINFEWNDVLRKNIERGTLDSNLEIYLRDIVRRLADTDIDQINWRGTIGGKATYPSNVLRPFNGGYLIEEKIEAEFHENYDGLAIFVDECRKQNVSPWVWIDAFDGYFPGCEEDFFVRNPDALLQERKKTEGTFKRVLPGVPCYANEKVRDYKLDQMRELSGYGIDGISYSLFNSHAVPYLGVGCLGGGIDALPYSYGFNPEIVAAYKERYNVDIINEDFDIESWATLQGEQFGDYLLMMRDLINEKNQKLSLVIRRDNHCAGAQYPTCYIGNTYKHWYDIGACDSLIIEGYNSSSVVIEESQNMVLGRPDIDWGLWHTIWTSWSEAQSPEKAEMIIGNICDSGLFKEHLFHEVDTFESGLQVNGLRSEAYALLKKWISLLKS